MWREQLSWRRQDLEAKYQRQMRRAVRRLRLSLPIGQGTIEEIAALRREAQVLRLIEAELERQEAAGEEVLW